MPRRFPILVFATLMLFATGATLQAQAVRKGNLVTSLGGGGGILRLKSDAEGVSGQEVNCGAVRFAFAHAFNDRVSLGLHYDRLGSDESGAPLERLRITTYMLEGVWRPWTGERAALEVHAGLGTSIIALRPLAGRLPYTANTGVVAVGARYLHLLSGSIGAFLAADHALAGQGALSLDGKVLRDNAGETLTMEWSSSRMTAGLLLRF